MVTRRTFLAISGGALTPTVWQALDAPSRVLQAAAHEGGRVTEPLLALVEDIVARAQQLDDQRGGADSAFVADQYRHVTRLVRHASYDARAGLRLAAAGAQLAQTAGFMAHDSGRDRAARRWYLAGLRAAHAAGDPGLTASILGLMSNHAIDLGHPGDATQLAAAALEAASHSTPRVQALLTARSSVASAATGDLTAVHRARERSLTLLDRDAARGDPPPRWARYATRAELDAIAGRGLVILAGRMPAGRDRLLPDAETLLHARAHTSARALPQRSALRHGAWLSLAYTRAGDLDHAADAGRLALTRLPTVTSVRSRQLLYQLRQELAAKPGRSRAVTALIADLDTQIPRASDPNTAGFKDLLADTVTAGEATR